MRVPVQIVDCETKRLVEAELFDEVTIGHFLETQMEWRPVVLAATKQLVTSGAPSEIVPRHFHWDWSSKEAELRVLAYSFFGLTCNETLQGLMKIDLTGGRTLLPAQKGKPAVYVDYLETAPWNIKVLMRALGKGPQCCCWNETH